MQPQMQSFVGTRTSSGAVRAALTSFGDRVSPNELVVITIAADGTVQHGSLTHAMSPLSGGNSPRIVRRGVDVDGRLIVAGPRDRG